jgi:hypothetical protein
MAATAVVASAAVMPAAPPFGTTPAQPSEERRAPIRSRATNCGPCGATSRGQPPSPYVFCSEHGGPITPKSFHTLIFRLGNALEWPSLSTRTSCAMAVATRWQTPATIPGPSSLGWGTRTFSTRWAIRSWRQIASGISGEIDVGYEGARIISGAEAPKSLAKILRFIGECGGVGTERSDGGRAPILLSRPSTRRLCGIPGRH